MKHVNSVVFSLCLALGAGNVLAQDSGMTKGAMSHDQTQDGMKKNAMAHDAMKMGTMSKGNMAKGAMSKDAKSSGMMKKDKASQDAAGDANWRH